MWKNICFMLKKMGEKLDFKFPHLVNMCHLLNRCLIPFTFHETIHDDKWKKST